MRNKTQKYFLRKMLAVAGFVIASFLSFGCRSAAAITIEGLDYVAPEYDRILGNYNAFDVRGKINGSDGYNFKTTYAHAGYSIDYTIDGNNTVWRNVADGAALINQNVIMTLSTTRTLAGVDVKLTMANPEDNGERAYKVAITSDVQIGSNDYAAIYKNGYAGLVATQDDSRYASDYGAKIFIDFSPDVQTLWIGPYNNRLANKFNNSVASQYTVADHVDTGAAWSWQGNLAAGENKDLITSFNLVETETSTIRFYDKTGALIEEKEALVGGAVALPTLTAAEDGYAHFWTDSADGEGRRYDGGTSIIVEDTEMNFYERTTANTYAISYNLNGGSMPEGYEREYTVEDDFVLAEPTREGYTFVGWTGANGNTPARTVRISGGSGNRSYTANWAVNQYTLTFNTNGGSSVGAITQDYGTAVTLPTTSKVGYEFKGWYEDEGFERRYTGTTMPAGNITLNAKWKVKQYTLHFDLGEGADGVADITGDYGARVPAPEEPTREGYTFAGWYMDGVRVGLDGEITIPAADVEITGTWEINQYEVLFVTGTEAGVIRYVEDYGAKVEIPEEPTKTGYEFKGWFVGEEEEPLEEYLDEEGKLEVLARDLAIVAKWEMEPKVVREIVERVVYVMVAGPSESAGLGGSAGSVVGGLTERVTENVETAIEESKDEEAIAPLGANEFSKGTPGKKGMADYAVETLRWMFCLVCAAGCFWFIILLFKRRKKDEEEEEEE